MLFLRQLAPCIGRIEFTFVWDHSFASDNSPPHIAATQYSLATHLERVFRWTQTFTGWFHGFISVRRGAACGSQGVASNAPSRPLRVRLRDHFENAHLTVTSPQVSWLFFQGGSETRGPLMVRMNFPASPWSSSVPLTKPIT